MTKRLLTMTAALVIVFCSSANAQELVQATSEDIDQFDQQLARQIERQKAKDSAGAPGKQDAAQSNSFGAAVSEEAKKAKDAGAGSKNDFGKWVSGQRSKSDDGRPGEVGSGKESGKDKTSSEAISRGAAGSDAGSVDGRSGRGRKKEK